MEKKKIGKSFFISAIILTLMIGVGKTTNATEIKTSLKIIQQASEITYLENKQGYLISEITNYDSQTGELTLQTILNNKKSENSEETVYDNTEIYIIVSENLALKTNIEKLNQYITYIETLATKVFNSNSKVKIGIIGMKGTIGDVITNEDGSITWGEKDERNIEGTDENAEIIIEPTNNTTELKNALMNMNNQKKSYYVNLQASIRLAKNSYSSNTNRILISMFDNVPTIAIGVKNAYTYYNNDAENAAREHISSIVDKTKSEILSLKYANIDFILLRPKDTSFDQKFYSDTTGELSVELDGSPYVKELYGTLESPTYGKMYSLDNNSIEKIITEYIYKDVIEKTGSIINSIEIKHYFTKEILDNFGIIVSSENNTEADTSALSKDGYIKWNISKLENGEKVRLEYTLKVKDMKNISILNKIISINEKIDLTYVDYLKENQNITTTSSPTIQLTEVKEEEQPNSITDKQEQNIDTTTATGTIPQTGINIIIAIIPIVAILILIIIYKKYNSYKDVK